MLRLQGALRLILGCWCVYALAGKAGVCAAVEIDYGIKVVWEGDNLEAARALLEGPVQTALARVPEPPVSLIHLKRRSERQLDYVKQAMRSFGFYGGEAKVEIDQSTEPVTLRYTIAPGTQYTLDDLKLEAADGSTEPLPTLDDLPIAKGAPAIAADILAVDQAVLIALRNAGHPFPSITDKKVVVDHATRTVRKRLVVDPGPLAVFGSTTATGMTAVQPEVIFRELPWAEGDQFDPALIAELQSRLYRTNLFSVVQVRTASQVDDDGRLPVTVEVSERKHRTIALGLRYFTDDGVGARAEWENRNMRGLGHRLHTELDLSTRRLGLSGGYEIPRFQRHDQRLELSFDVAQESTDAYDSTYFGIVERVERDITKRMTLGLGLGLRLSTVDRNTGNGGTESFQFLYAPAFFDYDGSNDKLNPTHGVRLRSELTPYLSISSVADSFLQSKTIGSFYWPLNGEETWVLASRVAVGLMGPASLDNIPADLRFYSGGGGSVRGYGYQLAGPLDAEDDPIGGRSLFEVAVEMRYRVSDTIGFAAFVDSGTVYDSIFPDFSEELRVGAGVGLRYYTPLGPFRLDVAVPVNGRDSDDSFQIYLSIGQAF